MGAEMGDRRNDSKLAGMTVNCDIQYGCHTWHHQMYLKNQKGYNFVQYLNFRVLDNTEFDYDVIVEIRWSYDLSRPLWKSIYGQSLFYRMVQYSLFYNNNTVGFFVHFKYNVSLCHSI